jgi:STE24 endopeptidase
MWLDVPDPNPFVVFWTYSHPPTAAREAFAAGYDPWAKGERPRYVK